MFIRFHITVVYVSGMWGAGCPVAAHFELLARDVLGVLRVRPPHIQPQQLGAAAEFWISHAGSYSDARLHVELRGTFVLFSAGWRSCGEMIKYKKTPRKKL